MLQINPDALEVGSNSVPAEKKQGKATYDNYPVSYTHLTLPTICSV